ncbi:hypothetical protein J2S21_003280 [Peribacillus cavernae]|nr:hypothetical protein [Peribacillus cavernae]
MSVLLRVFGTLLPESAIRNGVYNNLSLEQATEVVRGFVPESIRIYTDRIEALIPNVLKLYLKLAKDQELRLSQQDKMIASLVPQNII